MRNDISIDPKSMSAHLTFKIEDFNSEKDYKDALAILSMVAGDFHLDPEIEVEELKQFIEKAKNEAKMALKFVINEEELELELLNL